MIDLSSLLTLRAADRTSYVGPASREDHLRAFGGQLIAQALVAAGNTVTNGRPCHSLHGYFLRPGNTDQPITYAVDTVRDGRSFSMRSVDAVQNDKTIFRLMASFHSDEAGASQHADPMPDVQPPDQLTPFIELFDNRDDGGVLDRWESRMKAFDIRFVGVTPFDTAPTEPVNHSQVWIRCSTPLNDQLMHRGYFAYISDLTILDPILLAHGRRWTDGPVIGASLDHAIWFHDDIDMNQWMLFDHHSPVAGGNRGLAQTTIWNETGRLVATVVQEALLRPPVLVSRDPLLGSPS